MVVWARAHGGDGVAGRGGAAPSASDAGASCTRWERERGA